MGNTIPKIAKNIALALFQMESTDDVGYSWSIATQWDTIDNLFKSLRIGPYEYLRHLSFSEFIEEAKPYLVGLTVFLLVWILHWLRVESLVRKRTADLQIAQEKIQSSQEKISQLLRLGVVSQFSTVIAHELHQPLATMKYLADGIEIMAQDKKLNREKIGSAATQLSRAVRKAANIVSMVRTYAKEETLKQIVDLRDILSEIIYEVRNISDVKPKLIDKNPTVCANVSIDPIAIRIALINLIKNACEAAAEAYDLKSAFVHVVMDIHDNDFISIVIENSGKLLPPDFVEKLGNPCKSSKRSGLGYGILISITILGGVPII